MHALKENQKTKAVFIEAAFILRKNNFKGWKILLGIIITGSKYEH